MKKLEALMEVSKGEEVVCYMVEVYMHRRGRKNSRTRDEGRWMLLES